MDICDFLLHLIYFAGIKSLITVIMVEQVDEHINGFTFLAQDRYEVQENAVFLDLSLQALKANVDSFKTLNIYHRTALAKNIRSVKQALNDSPHFGQLLSLLAHDCEASQSQLVEYLKDVVSSTKEADKCRELIEPVLFLIKGAHLEMKEQGCNMLITLLASLSHQDRQPINKFAHDLLSSEEEDIKITGLQLIAKLTVFFSHEQAQHCFSGTLRPLFDTGTLRIKKETVASCGIIASQISQPFLNHSIVRNFLADRCKEPVMGVRKACAEVLPQLVAHTKEKEPLANLLLGLTKDGHKVVRLTACKVVPEFLGKYGHQHLPEGLLKFYIQLPDHEVNKIVNRENEILYPVAYYFTAVLQQMGAAGWPRLSVLFNKLLFIKHDEVTLPIASSLHEIAKVIGPELSHEYLFPAFNGIFKNDNDQLKLVALEHFSHFVSIFNAAMRESLIDVFMVLQKNPKKWRIRMEVAQQLSTIARNYDAETLFRYILPITLKLANDPVSAVREETARHMHEVILGMSKDPAYQNIAEESLKGFGLSEQYLQRETFARMIVTLHFLDDFKEKYYGIMLQLAQDPILLVRIALALSIKEVLATYPQKQQLFTETLAILMKEEDIRDLLE